MKIAVYGGSFNPPHLGHVQAAQTVSRQLAPDVFFIIPDNIPPHKDMAAGSPTPQQRMELCALAFRGVPGVQISDLELQREGRSYTADTVSILREKYPEDELLLVMGTDMLLSFEEWNRFEYLLQSCTLAVLARAEQEGELLQQHAAYLTERYGARIRILPHEPLPMQSREIREGLKERRCAELLDDAVYSCIIRNGYYEALPDLNWLREKAYRWLKPGRVAHVAGCEREAVQLARRWGEDPEIAATAGILHDMTKKLDAQEQLNLCEKYGIICDNVERENPKLLHAKTGAVLAREVFGVSGEICEAIRWHTTGRANMSKLEKILYLADYIEPTRDFPGVDALRKLCYEDLDAAMVLGLSMSLKEIRSHGAEPHIASVEAYQWYSRLEKGGKGMLTSAEIAAIAARALEEKKAKDVTILRTAEQTVLADYFVICNGTSSTHIKALVDEVDKKLSEAGEPPIRREGLRSDIWVLMDFGSVIVHVFTDEARKFYNLERLWSDAEVVSLSSLPSP